MPRISAPTIGAHVAIQEQRVFEEAVTLFIERGYGNVTFGDIAAAVGLARNSLYRYFPGKVDILTRWFHDELARRIERSEAVLSGDGAPAELIAAWIDDQLDYAALPQHQLLATIQSLEPELTPTFRAELTASHRTLLDPFRRVLADAGVTDPAARDAMCDLVSGLIFAASRHERAGGDPHLTRNLVRRGVAAFMS